MHATALSVLGFAFLALAPAPAHAQDTPDFRAEFQGQFETMAQKLVALSEAMPAESYAWSPAELYGRQVASWAVLLQLLTHMNEHLGQAIAYARMNRVVPPWSR